jgi:hypothetical protein
MIKSRRMRWSGHVALMGEGVRRVQGFGGKTRGKENTGETQAWMGMIILRQIFKKWYMRVWTGLSWLRIETGGGQL